MGEMRHERDRGQAAVAFVIVATVLFVVMVAALATMGRHAIDRGRAQSAADAAALASLDGGRSIASDFARRHGAQVVSWTQGPDHEVTIVVRVGEATATARATNEP